jgi:hypothetical protein
LATAAPANVTLVQNSTTITLPSAGALSVNSDFDVNAYLCGGATSATLETGIYIDGTYVPNTHRIARWGTPYGATNATDLVAHNIVAATAGAHTVQQRWNVTSGSLCGSVDGSSVTATMLGSVGATATSYSNKATSLH